MAVGLVSCVSGRRCCLGREGERRPEEGRDRLWEQKSQSRGTFLGMKSRGKIVERGSLGRAKGEGSWVSLRFWQKRGVADRFSGDQKNKEDGGGGSPLKSRGLGFSFCLANGPPC